MCPKGSKEARRGRETVPTLQLIALSILHNDKVILPLMQVVHSWLEFSQSLIIRLRLWEVMRLANEKSATNGGPGYLKWWKSRCTAVNSELCSLCDVGSFSASMPNYKTHTSFYHVTSFHDSIYRLPNELWRQWELWNSLQILTFDWTSERARDINILGLPPQGFRGLFWV